MLGFGALGELPLGGYQVDDAIYAEAGAFALTGQDAALSSTITRSLTADPATFDLTGNAAGLRLSMTAGRGTFVLTGRSAALSLALSAGAGAFSLTGNAAQLRLSMRALPAAFVVTGRPAALALTMSGGVAAYTLTGQAARLALTMRAAAAGFTLTGRAAGLRSARFLYALPDTSEQTTEYLLGGAPLGSAPLGGDALAVGTRTTFALNGSDVRLQKAITLVAEPAGYTLTGNDVGLRFAGRSNIRAFPRVSRPSRSFTRGGQPITAKASSGGFRARAYGG